MNFVFAFWVFRQLGQCVFVWYNDCILKMLSRQIQTHWINRIQFSDTFANVDLYSLSSKSVDKEFYLYGIFVMFKRQATASFAMKINIFKKISNIHHLPKKIVVNVRSAAYCSLLAVIKHMHWACVFVYCTANGIGSILFSFTLCFGWWTELQNRKNYDVLLLALLEHVRKLAKCFTYNLFFSIWIKQCRFRNVIRIRISVQWL